MALAFGSGRATNEALDGMPETLRGAAGCLARSAQRVTGIRRLPELTQTRERAFQDGVASAAAAVTFPEAPLPVSRSISVRRLRSSTPPTGRAMTDSGMPELV